MRESGDAFAKACAETCAAFSAPRLIAICPFAFEVVLAFPVEAVDALLTFLQKRHKKFEWPR